MKSQYLYSAATNLRLGPFDNESVLEHLAKQNNYLEWYIWEEGMTDWAIVKSDQSLVSQIELRIQKTLPPPPPVPKISTPPPPPFSHPAPTLVASEAASVEINEPLVTTTLTLIDNNEAPVAAAGRDNRKNPRYACQLRTIIINKKKTFITTTVDISLGGIRVTHPIPLEIFEGLCEVYISSPNNKESIILKCSSVSNSEQTHRFSFSEMDQKNIDKLELWLESLPEKK
ncbi:hypothetical protein CIK05_11690 [Bdellovibrio sp. qaytius]|nr:hypothetical protein CIK05_11690 [Bdellovibrio sp. qaytius]